jgi:hypothetical protein
VEESVLLANLIETNATKLAGAGDVDRNLITKRSFALKGGHSEEAAKELQLLGVSGSNKTSTPRKGTDADWHSVSEYATTPPQQRTRVVSILTSFSTCTQFGRRPPHELGELQGTRQPGHSRGSCRSQQGPAQGR